MVNQFAKIYEVTTRMSEDAAVLCTPTDHIMALTGIDISSSEFLSLLDMMTTRCGIPFDTDSAQKLALFVSWALAFGATAAIGMLAKNNLQ